MAKSIAEGKATSTVGLGRNWSWRDVIGAEDCEVLDAIAQLGVQLGAAASYISSEEE